jgi:hypothetical protein
MSTARSKRFQPSGSNSTLSVSSLGRFAMQPMTEYEESIGFYYTIGTALTSWANVERSLLWTLNSCLPKTTHIRSALMFLSIENFRSKLQVVDRLFSEQHGGTKHVSEWENISERIEKLSSIRNHLVHYHFLGYPNGKPGRKYALIPTTSPTPKFISKTPQPPAGSMFIREIEHARLGFNALAFALEFLVYRVMKHKTQIPTSLAQDPSAPTMATLTHQIRTILSQQHSPSD